MLPLGFCHPPFTSRRSGSPTHQSLSPAGGWSNRRALNLPRSTTDSIPASMPRNGLELARRSLQFVRPYRRPLCGVISLALVLAALSAIDPLVMKYLFDELERRTGVHSLIIIMSGLVLLELTRAGLQAWLGILRWDVPAG